jgi:hypothetical protein
MQVHGRCHCGKISFSATVDPESVRICHCADCQNLSGTAFRVTVRAAADAFTLLTGTPKVYIKTADSGNKRAHSFCPDCGTPIYAAAPENPPTYSLRLGTLAERAQLVPGAQQWCRSALPWADDVAEFPKIDRQ